jgi:hypothetical protein
MVIFHSFLNFYQRLYYETFGLSCPFPASQKKNPRQWEIAVPPATRTGLVSEVVTS